LIKCILKNQQSNNALNKVKTKRILIFDFLRFNLKNMPPANLSSIITETCFINSQFLKREVTVDLFVPKNIAGSSEASLLLINDGQNMNELGLENILESLYAENLIKPLVIAAIHAGSSRKIEYGTAIQPDYLGRGARAGDYTQFILQEVLPLLFEKFHDIDFKEKAFAGFSLGGLMALDIVWNHPEKFSKVGVFSGSLWWRSVDDTDEKYNDDQHRIMHQQIKKGKYHPGLKFFFTTGSLDETHDRNNNGIIDSIDDTLALIYDLESLGYENGKDICYINYEDGKHDVATWARAMPGFLRWGWGKSI
jgi:enterochelin esterase-like enzyme